MPRQKGLGGFGSLADAVTSLEDEVEDLPQSSPAGRRPVPTPGAQALLAPLGLGKPRISPRKRGEAEARLQKSIMRRWLKSHSMVAVQHVELSKARKAALRECFEMMDADSGGTINLPELSIAMKALGFNSNDIKEAMALGDANGDGELNFEEFCALISAAESQGESGGGSGADSFPFALIANSYRISKLVDSYNPALREPASVRGSSNLLPAIKQSSSPNSPASRQSPQARQGTGSSFEAALPPIRT